MTEATEATRLEEMLKKIQLRDVDIGRCWRCKRDECIVRDVRWRAGISTGSQGNVCLRCAPVPSLEKYRRDYLPGDKYEDAVFDWTMRQHPDRPLRCETCRLYRRSTQYRTDVEKFMCLYCLDFGRSWWRDHPVF